MSLGAWSGRRIAALWLGAILVAVLTVRVGDALRAAKGPATGFYIGSLFVWEIWLVWVLTWRWQAARKTAPPDRRWRWLQIFVVLFGMLWFAATLFEYA